MFDDVFFFEGNTHLPLEQHATVALKDPDGKLVVYSSTQTPHYLHRALAKALAMPAAHIRVIADPQRRRVRRQERSVQPRDRGRQGGAAARSSGEGLPQPRGSLLLPPRPSSGADALSHRRHQGRKDHRPRPADAPRRRRLRILRRREHLLYRRPADGDLRNSAVPLSRVPRVHQQAAVRSETRPRHAAVALRSGGATRQDRRAAGDRSRRPSPRHRRAARFADRQLHAGRDDRSGGLHPACGRALELAREVPQAAARSRGRSGLFVVSLGRRPADQLERSAALGRAAQARSQRRRHRLLRRYRDRPGVGRRAGGDGGGGARDRAVRRPGGHRRYRSHAGGPRVLLEPRDLDDGECGDPGGRAGARDPVDRGERTARDPRGAAGVCRPPGLRQRESGSRRDVSGSGLHGRSAGRDDRHDRLVHAAEVAGQIQGRWRRPVTDLLVHGGGRRSGCRSGDRMDHRAESLDRARHRLCPEPDAGAGTG